MTEVNYRVKISPSLMCADFAHMQEEIEKLENAGVDLFHFDINDGNFTPIITMGPLVISSLRKTTSLPFEAHIQIVQPSRQLEHFLDSGVNSLIFHVESCIDLFRMIRITKRKGLQVGIAINPITPLSYLEYIINELDIVLIMTVDAGLLGQDFVPATLEKIRKLRQMIDEQKLRTEIEVDGCINKKTIPEVVRAGANILVLGSSGLFGTIGNKEEIIKEVREKIKEARNGL